MSNVIIRQVVNLQITQEHITRGVPSSQTQCPIAQAWRSLGFTGVSVTTQAIMLFAPNDTLIIAVATPLPDAARSFITRFDHELPIEPQIITFNLAITLPDRWPAQAPALTGIPLER